MPFPTCQSVLLMVHLLFFIMAMCLAHFQFAFLMFLTISVTLVLCVMNDCVLDSVFYFKGCLVYFLLFAFWCVASFLTIAYVRDHVLYIGNLLLRCKTHWARLTFLDR